MFNKSGVYIFDGHGLKELDPLPKRLPIGAWARAGKDWEQLRMLPRQHGKRFEWVSVPRKQMPERMRATLLLLGET